MLRMFAAATCALLLAACAGKLPDGRYEGNLQRLGIFGREKEPIEIHIKKDGKVALHAKVFDRFEQRLLNIDLALKNERELELFSPEIGPRPFILFRYATEESTEAAFCFESRDGSLIKLCFSQYQFLLNIGGLDKRDSFSLTGNLFAKVKDARPRALETPRTFMLTQAVESAYDRNFESRAAIEHVLQAKGAALAAWLNLIPHLSANLIWNADFGYISAIATLQAFAPFVLPSYWLQARTSDIDVKIKHDALLLVRANLALSVEQLAYAHERDRQLMLAHVQVIEALQSYLRNLETELWIPSAKLGQITTNMNAARSLLGTVEQGKSDIEVVLKEDRFSLAAALGLHNPEGVLSVLLDREDETIDRAPPQSPQNLAILASKRSFEADQLEYMTYIARLKRIELYFTWMDPAGDQRQNLGFNLVGSHRVAASQQTELDAKRVFVKDTIYQDAYRTAEAYNRTLRLHGRFQGENTPAEAFKKFQTELNFTQFSGAFDTHTIESAVQNYLKQTIEYQSNLANFRTARAKKDRLMLSGYYERLMFRLPTARMIPPKAEPGEKPSHMRTRPLLNIPANKL